MHSYGSSASGPTCSTRQGTSKEPRFRFQFRILPRRPAMSRHCALTIPPIVLFPSRIYRFFMAMCVQCRLLNVDPQWIVRRQNAQKTPPWPLTAGASVDCSSKVDDLDLHHLDRSMGHYTDGDLTCPKEAKTVGNGDRFWLVKKRPR